MADTGTSSKRSNSPDQVDDQPPAKLPKHIIAGPSWADLRPELVGHIARYLPMGTPDMMRLLLRVGPRVAAVVCKMYLTDNDYYLSYYTYSQSSDARAMAATRYWMEYNKKTWKQRCRGKADKNNVLSFFLTTEQIRSLDFAEDPDFLLVYCVLMRKSFNEFSALGDANVAALAKLTSSTAHFILVSIGDKDVDDSFTAAEGNYPFIKNVAPNDEGKVCVRFMRMVDAFFAYPHYVIGNGNLEVLKFMIEEKIIEPSMTIVTKFRGRACIQKSLLFFAFKCDSISAFRYLLSLPNTDVNANAISVNSEEGLQEHYESMIHSCVINSCEISLSCLEALIANSRVNLNARDFSGATALYHACRAFARPNKRYQTMAKIRMLLKAGADPRIAQSDGDTPLLSFNYLIDHTRNSKAGNQFKLKLLSLREEVSERIAQLENEEAD